MTNRNVFALYVERETSQDCKIIGVWKDKLEAISAMQNEIENDDLYTELSKVDTNIGFAQSDPTYSEDTYSDYRIDVFELK